MWWICTADMKLIYYKPVLHVAIITLRTKKMFTSCCRLRMQKKPHKKKQNRLRSAHTLDESHVSSLQWALSLSACTKPACLCRATQMGMWGDGCCQLTDQAVGRWSHCYSPHKHVGHVRHVPWRHTSGGCCALVFMLFCNIYHRLRVWTEELAPRSLWEQKEDELCKQLCLYSADRAALDCVTQLCFLFLNQPRL